MKLFHQERRPIIPSVVHPSYYSERSFDIRASRRSIFWCRDPGNRQCDRMDGHEERNASQLEAVSTLTTDKLRRLKRSRGGHKSFVNKTRETLESIFDREETLSIRNLEKLKKNVHALRQSLR